MSPLLVVLAPFLLIISFVTVKIKRYLDEYVPRRVTVGHKNGRTVLSVETKKKSIRITVKTFWRTNCKGTLEVRLDGLAFGRYRLGLYKGTYGYVSSYALSDSGLLIEDLNGKKYYLAFDNIREVEDAIMDESTREKVIEVRK